MMRDDHSAGDGPTFGDRERYAAALAAANEPNVVLRQVHTAFVSLLAAVCAGDFALGAPAARDLELRSLQLCVAPATSTVAADDRRRITAIIGAWASPRRPALAAVLAANTAQEAGRWGGAWAGEA